MTYLAGERPIIRRLARDEVRKYIMLNLPQYAVRDSRFVSGILVIGCVLANLLYLGISTQHVAISNCPNLEEETTMEFRESDCRHAEFT